MFLKSDIKFNKLESREADLMPLTSKIRAVDEKII